MTDQYPLPLLSLAAITMCPNFLPETVTKFAKSGLIELLHGEDVGVRTVVRLDLNNKKIIPQLSHS
jgi:hypothetical protein